MMLPRTALSTCAALLLAAVLLPASAQVSSSDGSPYSRLGLGELRDYASSQTQAMGGSSTAMTSLRATNFANPGTWADQVATRFAGSIVYQGLELSDASGASSQLTEGSLRSIQFSFPILNQKLGFALGYTPFSSVSYRVSEERAFADALPDTVSYLTSFEGRGGLQELTTGLGWRLNRHLAVGASADVIFGIIENGQRTVFLSPGYAEADPFSALRLSGVTATTGVLVTAPSLLGEEDLLTVGATFTLPTTLRGDLVRTLGESLDRDTLDTEVSGSVDIPLRAGLGVAYRFNPSWLVAVDGRYEPWSQFEATDSLGLGIPGYDADRPFNDRYRIAGGVEWLPAGRDFTAPYFSRAAYRLGFYVDRTYVRPAPDVDLRTVAATAGVSLPALLAGMRLDLNLEVGTRGTTDQELVREVFYGFSLSINFGERWFEKRKLR